MAVTKRRGCPRFSLIISLGALFSILIVGFQNCSVDLSMSTPGASSAGACGSPPAAALPALQNVISGVLQTNCSSCHGVANGSVKSGFYTPDTTSDPASAAVQSFTYTQLCARGGKAVGVKISGSHGGGTFTSTGPAAALFTYLDTYF